MVGELRVRHGCEGNHHKGCFGRARREKLHARHCIVRKIAEIEQLPRVGIVRGGAHAAFAVRQRREAISREVYKIRIWPMTQRERRLDPNSSRIGQMLRSLDFSFRVLEESQNRRLGVGEAFSKPVAAPFRSS